MKQLISFTFLTIISFCSAQISFVKEREYLQITDWQFKEGNIYNAQHFTDNFTDWQSVKVPHTYSMDAIEENGYYRGVAWYSTSVTIPNSMKNKRVFIRFEAVGHEARVYLNGKDIGTHSGGYSAFCFDITDKVKIGESNRIAVKVSNEPNFKIIPVTDKLFNIYGGIYRPVQIFATPETHISPVYYASSGIFVKPLKVSKNMASINLEAHINGAEDQEARLHCIIKDAKEEIVIEKNVEVQFKSNKEILNIPFEITSPTLWDGLNNPHIYTAEITLKTGNSSDKITQTFGLKYYKVDPQTGFYLNGTPYDLHGVAMHQEWKQVGPALLDEHHNTDMAFVEEIGATTVRLSHYQHSEMTYDLADKKGILLWSEIPFVHDYSGREFDNAKQQLKELILQNYNHPSIFIWGLWNEVRAWKSPDEPCVQLTKELQQLAKELDSTRLTVSASDRGIKSNMNGISDLQAWNKYFGWYYGVYEDVAKWLDESHEAHPDVALAISEYGAGANVFQQDISKLDKPFGLHFPEQDQTYCHEVSWKIIKDRPFVWSSYVWNLFDFSVSDWNRGGIPYTNHKGLITYDRSIKKDAFYFYKANWSKEPVLYISERRNKERSEAVNSIKVYTNQPQATLYLNGKRIKKQKLTSDVQMIRFENIQLQQGKNTIEVASGDLTDKVEWTLK